LSKDFWYFDQILMDNHKLVTIYIFLENMHEKPLEFGHIGENKTNFFVFLKWGNLFLNLLEFSNFGKKSGVLIVGLYFIM
jgi:hypothetical protein